MSISQEIQRIKTNIANAYTLLERKGAVLPQSQNSANLVDTINSIMGYTELDYIESTGTQYINTEVKTSLNLRIECEYSTTTANKVLFGARTNASEDCLIFGYFYRTTSYYANFGGATSINEGNISNADGNKHKVVMSNDVFTIDNASQLIKKGELNNSLDIYLFSWDNNGTADSRKFIGKIYSFKIYNNDTLIRDLRPARKNSDGTICMYDKVNEKFYYNLRNK